MDDVICLQCGARVVHEDIHFEWHADQQANMETVARLLEQLSQQHLRVVKVIAAAGA